MAGTIRTTIALLALSAAIAVAREQRLHKGHATEGEVVSVSKDSLVMQTQKGTVSVTLSDATTVERGDGKVARDAIKKGARVSVFGTTLASGEVVAREVLIHAGHHQEGHPGGDQHR